MSRRRHGCQQRELLRTRPLHLPPDVTGRLVRVSTGAMEVWIDRLGGDIVRVRLPRYPVSIDEQNEPFLLLDTRSDHVYVAQSGLIGRDGPDGRSQRPLYEASAAELDLPDGGELRLTTLENSIEIHKVFVFTADDYLVSIKYEVINHSDKPFEARQFAQLKRDGQRPNGWQLIHAWTSTVSRRGADNR